MAMTIRFDEEQTTALRVQAVREGRSMQQVVLDAVEEYLVRRADDEATAAIAREGAERYRALLDRLGQ